MIGVSRMGCDAHETANGDTMKLPSIRPTAAKSAEPVADPKAPHHFQEVYPGCVPCALCHARQSDRIHITEELDGLAKWGI
jgi:hypothetical protein